jgi:hypothetical protein
MTLWHAAVELNISVSCRLLWRSWYPACVTLEFSGLIPGRRTLCALVRTGTFRPMDLTNRGYFELWCTLYLTPRFSCTRNSVQFK